MNRKQHNEVTGTVNGNVVQANTIGTVNVFDGPVTVHGDFTMGNRGKDRVTTDYSPEPENTTGQAHDETAVFDTQPQTRD